jgi:putative membrane protein
VRVEELFGEAARDAVSRAVETAEARTSGEIVVMVVEASDGYAGVRMGAAAALGFIAGLAVLALGLDPVLWLPPVQLAGFGLGFALGGLRALLGRLAPRALQDASVDRAARAAFLSEGVLETRDRTGILIYVSLLEHRVQVLADRGIHARVEAGTWDGVVERILAGVRAERAEAGLVEAIACCGELLAQHFPPRPDDKDELANRMRG